MEVHMKLAHRYLFFGLGLLLLLVPTVLAGCGPQSQAPGTVSSSEGTNTSNPIPKDYSEFQVGPLSVVRNGVGIGEAATVSASVTNTGGIQGTYNAVLTVDGKQTSQKDVAIGPGATESVSFQVTENTPGGYKLEIDGSTATLNVYQWPVSIQYDLGNTYGESVSLSNDYGHIVHFTPPTTPFKIQTIDVYVQASVSNKSDWDNRFVTVRIWNSNRTQQLWSVDLPWSDFRNDVGSFWKTIQVPNVTTNGDFYVEIVTHSNQFQGEMASWSWGPEVRPAIFLGYDRSTPYQTSTISTTETRSTISEMGQFVDIPTKYEGLNWLIRVQGDGSI
jgi:hypothetical protein